MQILLQQEKKREKSHKCAEESYPILTAWDVVVFYDINKSLLDI